MASRKRQLNDADNGGDWQREVIRLLCKPCLKIGAGLLAPVAPVLKHASHWSASSSFPARWPQEEQLKRAAKGVSFELFLPTSTKENHGERKIEAHPFKSCFFDQCSTSAYLTMVAPAARCQVLQCNTLMQGLVPYSSANLKIKADSVYPLALLILL